MNSSDLTKIIKDETDIKAHTCNVVLDGWDNIVLEVDNEYIFRFTRRDDTLKQHLKELALLPELNKNLTLQVPNPAYYRHTGEPPFYTGYRKIPGTALSSDKIGEVDRGEFIEVLAEFFCELQDVPIEPFRDHVPVYTGKAWRERYEKLMGKVEKHLFSHLDEKTRGNICQMFDVFLDNPLNFNFIPTLSHNDLSSDHILYEGGVVTGVIDWGDSCFGDPAFDLTGLIVDYGVEFARALCGVADFPLCYVDRCGFYVKVIPFYEALLGAETGDRVHLEAGLAGIKKTFGN